VKMEQLISAILALSRAGKRELKPETIDMSALVNGVVATLAHEAQAVGAEIEVGTLPPITCDRLALEQVFSNLLDNALKYLRPEQPGRIQVTGFAASGRLIYEVRDNGRGIAEADQKRVFELFRRAGAQDQRGEGIGLAHVRAVVRRLALLWQIYFEAWCEEFLTMRASPGWRLCEEVEDGLPDRRHARLGRRPSDSFFSVPRL